MVKKILKKSKNDILYARLGNMNKTYSNKIISIIDDIYDNLTKICFYKLGIDAKIMQNSNIKSMSEITKKQGRVNMDL